MRRIVRNTRKVPHHRRMATVAISALAVAPIFGLGCKQEKPAALQRSDGSVSNTKEAKLLAKLPKLKSMDDSERYRLFDQLKEVGGAATVKALIPLLDGNSFGDSNVWQAIETLQAIGAGHIDKFLDLVKNGTYYQENNAIRVIGGLPIDRFRKLEILFGLYKERGTPYQLDSEIRDLLDGKLDSRVLALVNRTYNDTNSYGRYSILCVVGKLQYEGVVQLLTRALEDSEPSTRQRAAQQLREYHTPSNVEGNIEEKMVAVLWKRVEVEDDQDALYATLELMRDKRLISTGDCEHRGRKKITRDDQGRISLERGETLDCLLRIKEQAKKDRGK